MCAKKYEPNVGTGTAVCLRLMRPWLYKGRHLFGDSWFASVTTCLTLLMNLTSFTGPVKTCTKGFPLIDLKRQPISADKVGNSYHLQTDVQFPCPAEHKHMLKHPCFKNGGIYTKKNDKENDFQVLASAWLDESSRRIFVTSEGSSANAHQKIQRKKYLTSKEFSDILQTEHVVAYKVTKHINVPNYIDQYYNYHNIVDRHNRFRSDLGIEKKIPTKTWHFRIFCSLLGIIVVDAWLMYKHSRLEDDINENKYKNLQDFTTELALELCSMKDPVKDFYPYDIPTDSFFKMNKTNKRKADQRRQNNDTQETTTSVKKAKRIEIIMQPERYKTGGRKQYPCLGCKFHERLYKDYNIRNSITTVCSECLQPIHRRENLPEKLQDLIKQGLMDSCLDSHICSHVHKLED